MRALRVLVVEDNPTDRAFMRLILGALPDVVPTIDEVESGREATALIRQNTYDIVIADNHLVGPVTGIDVLRVARDVQPNCRRVFITGDTQAHILEEAKRRAEPAALLSKVGFRASHMGASVTG